MAKQTTTIRVPIATRDRLVAQAQRRGVSMAVLVGELSEKAERQYLFEVERAATVADAGSLEVQGEDLDWGY